MSAIPIAWRWYGARSTIEPNTALLGSDAVRDHQGTAGAGQSGVDNGLVLSADQAALDGSSPCGLERLGDPRCSVTKEPPLQSDAGTSTLAATTPSAAPESTAWPLDWISLGDHEIIGNERRGHLRIELDYQGQLSKLMLRAERCDLEIANLELAAPLPARDVHVNIGPMSSKVGSSDEIAKVRATMRMVAMKTMSKVASNMLTTWPGGVPTAAELAQKNVLGVYIDGTLNDLQVVRSGSSTTISCKVNMLLATFPEQSAYGFLNGGAKVQSSGSPSDVALAREDCLWTVVDDLIAKKIVPTIKSRANWP